MFKIERHTELLSKTRANALNVVESLTLEQLNTVPEGFNNTIAWNFIHGMFSNQGLIYGMSGLPFQVAADRFDGYKKGDAGSKAVTQEQIDFFKKFAIESIAKLEADYKSGIFKTYKTYETSYGYTITNAQEAIIFSNVHEGVHFGYMLAMKHLV